MDVFNEATVKAVLFAFATQLIATRHPTPVKFYLSAKPLSSHPAKALLDLALKMFNLELLQT